MSIDQSSIEFVSATLGDAGDTYIIVYEITEYNSVPLAEVEELQKGYYTSNSASLIAPVKEVKVKVQG